MLPAKEFDTGTSMRDGKTSTDTPAGKLVFAWTGAHNPHSTLLSNNTFASRRNMVFS
jgi:hypothetical protein